MGVGIATVTDLQLNALGSFLSLLAVITTCVAQIVSLKIISFTYMYQYYEIIFVIDGIELYITGLKVLNLFLCAPFLRQ
jgi:hypothetical protein